MTSTDKTVTLTRRRVILATTIAVAIASASSAIAHPDPVDLKVVDRETGEVLPSWRHDGRMFVAGEPGSRYSLRVSNHTDGRLLLVLSVDGVNVVTGETADYDQLGYVLDAHGSYDVNGWRKSHTEVAAFAFAPLPKSYAARTGRPGDVGVIGMAVFKERAARPVPYPLAPSIDQERQDQSRFRSQDAANADTSRWAASAQNERRATSPGPLVAPPPPPPALPMAPAPKIVSAPSAAEGLLSKQDEKLGTAHGAREWSVVSTTTFVRATSYPQSVRKIEYDTYANLVSRGVAPGSSSSEHPPRPFPSNSDEEGFVPDPPNAP